MTKLKIYIYKVSPLLVYNHLGRWILVATEACIAEFYVGLKGLRR